jgi:uncharacterized protein (TIRG00374 family)
MFFSLFFPSVIGGDFVKIFYVKRDTGTSLSFLLASIYLERATGMLALLVYGLVAALFYPFSLMSSDFQPIGWFGLSSIPVWILPATMLIGFISVNYILFGSRLYQSVIGLLNFFRLGSFSEKILNIRDAMQSFKDTPSALLLPTLLSFINIGLAISQVWLIALALNIELSIIPFAAIVPLMTILVMLPISINGIGLRENAFVVLLAPLGVEPDKSFALSVITLVVIIIAGLPGGIVYSVLKKKMPVPAEADLIVDR